MRASIIFLVAAVNLAGCGTEPAETGTTTAGGGSAASGGAGEQAAICEQYLGCARWSRRPSSPT